MQLYHNSVKVNKYPKHYKANPIPKNHSLLVKDNRLKIPLDLTGIISYFPVRKPISKEVELYESKDRQDLTAVNPE